MAVDKAEEGLHWARWATATTEGVGGSARGPKRHARNVLGFDVGSVVVALKEDGEVWVCTKDLEWEMVGRWPVNELTGSCASSTGPRLSRSSLAVISSACSASLPTTKR
jgi:hypothetical protein